jgi:hypothetical protein
MQKHPMMGWYTHMGRVQLYPGNPMSILAWKDDLGLSNSQADQLKTQVYDRVRSGQLALRLPNLCGLSKFHLRAGGDYRACCLRAGVQPAAAHRGRQGTIARLSEWSTPAELPAGELIEG